jgi:hypothetical protein
MSRSAAQTVSLVRHPETRASAARAIVVRVARVPGGTLELSYAIRGDPERLRVPEPRPPRAADGLWRHTCCEAFVALAGASAYHEFNFSPSGEWAAYAFEHYREGRQLVGEGGEPRIVVRRAADGLELDASVPLARLSSEHAGGKITLALSAVIEDENASRSYWALKHAPGKPDFHHPDAFALTLDEIRN